MNLARESPPRGRRLQSHSGALDLLRDRRRRSGKMRSPSLTARLELSATAPIGLSRGNDSEYIYCDINDSPQFTRNAPPHVHKIADRQPPPTLDTLIGLQRSSGYFLFSDQILCSRVLKYFAPSVLEKLNEQIRKGTSLFWSRSQKTAEIRDTILTIIFIEAQYPDLSELYELVVQKARSWLRGKFKSDETLNELEKIARDEMRKGEDKNEDGEDDEDEAEEFSSRKDEDDEMDVDKDDTKESSS
jgi:hypothetical protein